MIKAYFLFLIHSFIYFFQSLNQGSSSGSMSLPSTMNNARGVDRSSNLYEFPGKVNEDVIFDLVEMEKVAYGQPFTVSVQIQVITEWTISFFSFFFYSVYWLIWFNRIVRRKWGLSLLSCRLPVFITPVSVVVDWDVSIVSWSSNLDRVRQSHSKNNVWSNDSDRCWLIAGETLQVRAAFEDYRDKIVDYGMIKFYALASVLETKQCWSEEDDFQLEKPKIDVQVLESNPRFFTTNSFLLISRLWF